MPDVNVYEAVKELIQRLLGGDEELAALAATDPEGTLSAFADGDLEGLDFRQIVDECYHDYELPDSTREALQSYVSGGPPPDHFQVKAPPDGYQSPAEAVQHLQYVTYATYENHDHITRDIVSQQFTIDQSDNRIFDVDNSQNFDGFSVGGDFGGDITNAPATAAGDGAVAGSGGDVNAATGDGAVSGGGDVVANTGEGDQFAATGDGNVAAATAVGSQAIGGDNTGLANTGAGAVQGEEIGAANTGLLEGVQTGGDIDGPTNTGQFEGVQAGRDADGLTNTGVNTGVLAGGDADRAVLGDGNQTANLDIDASGGAGGGAGGSGGDASGTGGSTDATGGSGGVGGGADGSGGDGGSGGVSASGGFSILGKGGAESESGAPTGGDGGDGGTTTGGSADGGTGSSGSAGGTGGDASGTGGDAGGGAGGTVQIGTLFNNSTVGDVTNSAVSGEGDASNDASRTVEPDPVTKLEDPVPEAPPAFEEQLEAGAPPDLGIPDEVVAESGSAPDSAVEEDPAGV